jgi:DinB family protein
MLDTLKELLANQFEAALSMFNTCIDRCPETVWTTRVANYRFCQVVFHTLFWTDFYLGPDDEQKSFRRQPFHRANERFFGDYEEFEDRAPVSLYDKTSIKAYLEHCRNKAAEVVAAETAETLGGPSGFARRKFSRAELHVYNIRHIQHHTAQLSLRLRLDANQDVPWAGSGWREV